MVAICVDAGTSVVKAVAFDDEGQEIALSKQQVPIARPHPGWSEQDMNAVWEAVASAIRETALRIQGPVRFLSVTGQGDGCWLIDEHGSATGPAILWNDGRATDIVEQWQQSGVLDKVFRLNGTLIFPGAQSAILSWLMEHDPRRLERSSMAIYCKDWVILNLTGIAATEESDGSFPFFDIRARQYAPALLDLYDLGWAQRLLAPVRDTTAPVGALLPSIAAQLGLPAGLPVVAAPYDIAATAIGMGAVRPGQAVSILGTTLCNEVVVDTVRTDEAPAGLHVCSGLPRRWLRGFATMCGTEAIGWLCSLIGGIQPAEITELAQHANPGAGGVTFLPYLSPSGERAPFLNTNARTSLSGLSLEHSREHVARAVLEGLSFVIRECLEASQARPTQLNVCGGGAVSDLWCQIIADITCVPVRTTTIAEVGAFGAYVMGMKATGLISSVEEAIGAMIQTRKLYQPRDSTCPLYAELYQHFLQVRDHAAQDWARQQALRAKLSI